MGKPFKKELEDIYRTLEWANSIDIKILSKQIGIHSNIPGFIVGSGGSLSACHYAAQLHQMNGVISKAVTPLEMYYSSNALRHSRLTFISASGRNNDILFGFKNAIQMEPRSITSICMKTGSKLAELSNQYSISEVIEYDIPSGKDGFLATNSLIAYYTLLYRAFENQIIRFSRKAINDILNEEIDCFIDKISEDHSLTILFGGWGQPVAVDLESKCTEAALCNTLPTDYRNFGHGRHHWFAKKNKSAIVALITPMEEQLALKTLKALPKEIPQLIIQSGHVSPFSSIDLLIKTFFLVNKLGELHGIDPGKPGVPEFGRRLYNLRYNSYYSKKNFDNISSRASIAIQRKAKISSLQELSSDELSSWRESYNKYITKLSDVGFGSLIFDYDGTLCSTEERCDGVSEPIARELIRILDAGFIIGIVTGRGRSIRSDMQKVLPTKLWRNVILGYYNGAEIGALGNNLLPNRDSIINDSLSKIYELLIPFETSHGLELTLRPHQLSVEVQNETRWENLKNWLLHEVHNNTSNDIRIVESCHSIDIIPVGNSKLSIIPHCQELATSKDLPSECLCIGDKGQWPGNDFQLLSTEYSLSVAEVSYSTNSCWNIAEAGRKNILATFEYLTRVQTNRDYMKFNIVK